MKPKFMSIKQNIESVKAAIEQAKRQREIVKLDKK